MNARITPTEWAEQAYQAKLKQHRPMRRGPAGLPLPSPRAIFRKEADAKLLSALARVALKSIEDADTSRQPVTDALMRRGARAAFAVRVSFITMWPGQFRHREGRWPRWQEIEAAQPILGDWLKAQRNG